jgi:hypothetical protein
MTTTTIHIERGEDESWRELTVEITGTVTPYRAATLLDPEEGDEIEDIEARLLDGTDVELTAKERDKAEQALREQAAEDAAEARAARADWERESRYE